MKGIRKIILIVITIMIINIMPSWLNEQLRASAGVTEGQPVKIGVFLIDFTDDYISLVRKNLEEIGEKNQENVQFNFFDAKNNQDIQNQDIDKAIKEGIDLALLNIVDRGAAQSVINKFKENNIPVILFNREPNNMDTIKSYGKALYIGTNPKEAGMLQGKVIVNAWNGNKQFIDKNKDNIIQYVMLMGESDNIEAIERTKYSVSTIQEAGIKTEELAVRVSNWNTDLARNITESLLMRYGDKIELIIANDDSMALGAVQALQLHGYNKGGKTKTIAVVGVDALPETQELISKGIMLGSVFQDPSAMAEALYQVGMNLVSGKNPLEDTNYKFDDTGVSIRLPYKEYVINNRHCMVNIQ